MDKILIIENEDTTRMSLRKLLESHGFETCQARNIQKAMDTFELSEFSLVIAEDGTELIQRAGPTPVLIISRSPSVKSAVEAMHKGAADYLSKPLNDEELLFAVKRLLNTQKSSISLDATHNMIGSCESMKQVFNIIRKVARTDATVLIHGETGTGKELAANAIHNESNRSKLQLICVNCAAIPENLIEAELFGHEKGAFTGATEARKGLVAAADKGTLFLDEVGELPLEAQARLLRVLQEQEVRPIGSVKSRKVDIRLVAATHRNLKKLCEKGLFREDLFYRINVVNLDLPPLRDRNKDLLNIAEALLQKQCKKLNKHHLILGPDAIQAIITYGWPGNIRELENSLERAAILCDDNGLITHDLLGIKSPLINLGGTKTKPHASDIKQVNTEPPEGLSLEDYFTQFVLENQEAMSETELAQKLGISRKCLWERRHKLGIPRKITQ